MNKRRTIFIATVLVSSLFVSSVFISCQDAKEQTPTEQVKQNENNHPAAGVVKNNNAQGVKKTVTQAKRKSTGPKPGEPLKAGDLEWLHIEDAGKLDNKEGKKFLVDIYTDWCGWCKVMDKQTFSDPAIQAYLNDNFHVIKFNAEQKESIEFRGEKYDLIKSGRNGVNALAVKLLGQRLSYPTIVYLDEDLNKITAVPGFKKPDQLMQTLKMIAG